MDERASCEYPVHRQEAATTFIKSARARALLWESLAPPRRPKGWPPSRATTVRFGRRQAELLVQVGLTLMFDEAETRGPSRTVFDLLSALVPALLALRSGRGKRHRHSPNEVRSLVEKARSRKTANAIEDVAAYLSMDPRTVRRALKAKPLTGAAKLLLTD